MTFRVGTTQRHKSIRNSFRVIHQERQHCGATRTNKTWAECPHWKVSDSNHMLLSLNIATQYFVGADVVGFLVPRMLRLWRVRCRFSPYQTYSAVTTIATKRQAFEVPMRRLRASAVLWYLCGSDSSSKLVKEDCRYKSPRYQRALGKGAYSLHYAL
jgi:hypothetical protein